MIDRVSRRHALAALGAAGGATVIPGSVREAAAKAPLSDSQVAAAARFKVGKIEVTALFDGYAMLEDKMFPQLEAGRATELRDKAFIRPGPLGVPVIAFLVNLGDKLILIDTGNSPKYGPQQGRLTDSIDTADTEEDDVDAVLITHVHPDHTNGLLTAKGQRAFPKAELVMQKAEHDYWNDPGKLTGADAGMKRLLDMALPVFKPYARSTRLFEGAVDVFPGIRSVPLFGHTPGHTGYMISSGSDQLLIWGDVVHAEPFQFAEPGWAIVYDTNPEQAVATRRRTLDMVSKDRIPVAGAHLPFPGKGYVAREGNGYRFVPSHLEPHFTK